MKIFLIQIALFSMTLSFAAVVETSGQKILEKKVSLDVDGKEIRTVFKEITRQTSARFTYRPDVINPSRRISLHLQDAPLSDVLERLFGPDITYTAVGREIVLKAVANRADVDRAVTAPGADDLARMLVSGKVTDEKGDPLPGVNVFLKGTSLGTGTDANGGYKIDIDAESGFLVFSFIGYQTMEVAIDGRSTIDVSMAPDVESLKEVVVVGYGIQKKVTTIGAQSSVRVTELKQPVANLSNAIAGRIAGIVGVQRSGEPGYDNSEVYIRGISSFASSGSNPLILVDGVERPFNNIDPEDIESFSILKDASATAIYGVRGGNGVILINTKKGKVTKPQISIQYNQGITQFTKLPAFADGPSYMQMANEARRNSDPTRPPVYTQGAIDSTRLGLDPDLYPNVDWFKEIFNDRGQNRRLNFNVNGGSEKATYYLSLAYYNEQGLFKNESLRKYASGIGFNRYNFTSNLSLDITRTTKVAFGASGYISHGNYPGSSTGSIFGAAYILPPIVHPARYSDGRIAQQRTADIFNPYALLTQSGYTTETRSQIWSNIRVTQQLDGLIKGLSATAMFSFDNFSSYRVARNKSVDRWLAVGRDSLGRLRYEGNAPVQLGSNVLGYNRENGGNNQNYLEAALNYNTTVRKHEVSAMILYNQISRIDAFTNNFTGSIPYRFHGLAGRATYAYDQRYMLEANFGYNGSEAFAPTNRYGFFPSAGIGWIPSNEKFFRPLDKYVQFLKIRLSHGIVGNAVITSGQRFAYLSTVGDAGDYDFGKNQNRHYDGLDIEYYASNVQWEKSTKSNLGVEIGALQDALSLTVDFFRNVRSGIYLQRSDMPEYTGVRNNPTGNLGEIFNRGVDATLEFRQSVGEHVQLGFRGNFTWNRSTVVEDANAPWPYTWQERVGRKLGQRFGYTAVGLFESEEEIANSARQTGTVKPGDIKYKDLNSDGVIDDYDQSPIGFGSFPEIVYGFGPTVTWKGWSLGAFFKGIGNVDIMLNGEGLVPFERGVGTRGNLLSTITDRWTPENPNPHATYPRISEGVNNMNYAASTWWMRDGSYLRLQNVEFSYTFPKRAWFDKIGLGNMRLYFLSYNAITWSRFKLWDVELGDGRGSTYPLVKTYTFGVDCKF